MMPKEIPICRKNVYCDFQLSRDLPDALTEVCRFCSRKVIYNKGPRGRIDNNKYLRDHLRATVQPFGKTANLFRQIYGEKILQEFYMKVRGKKTKLEMQTEWEKMRQDIRKRFEVNRIFR